jgi:hypothetical protein
MAGGIISLTSHLWAILRASVRIGSVSVFHQSREILTVRILITVKPRMYREAIAMAIYRHRPDAEILLAPPESVDGESSRFRPHLMVRNDTEGATLDTPAGEVYQVKVLYSDGLDAEVSLDGRSRTVRDMSLDDLLRIVDEAEELIPSETTE